MSDAAITLTINGQSVAVPPGTTILAAAKSAGIDIPTICYHPNLTPNAVCRLCTVEVQGARVLLAPTVNLQRTVYNGRNFECHSEDPWLSSEMAVAYVRGLQSTGVAATIKHFVGNESEYQRLTVNSRIPERALRELYLVPFERAVKENPDNSQAVATLAVARYEAGDHKKAFALLRKVMRAQIDPEPIGALLRDPRYHDLCIRYRIPIELSDEDARTLA